MKHIIYKSRFNYLPQNRQNNCAETFEELLLFDAISYNIVGINHPLLFLIEELGLNKVEELLENKSIEFITGIPLIAANAGPEINGMPQYKGIPPLLSAKFTNPENSDPEYQLDEALKLIVGLNRDRRRIFKRIALKQYKIPNSKFSSDAHKFVLDAYLNNKLTAFGLPNIIEPENIGINERKLLADIGYDIIETALLSQFKYKSKNNNKALLITKDTFDNFFNAVQISKNNSTILKLECLPDMENLFKLKNYNLSNALYLRDSNNSKKYRSWINEKTDELSDTSITKSYIDEIAKESGFFNSNNGKLIKTISIFSVSSYLGFELADLPGLTTGLGISLIDTYLLESWIKGWNPRFFIDELRKEINEK